MKKTFILILALIIAVACIIPSNGVFADENIAELDVNDFLIDFVTNNPTRVAGSSDEKKAGEYIAKVFAEMGYSVKINEFSYEDDSKVQHTSQNVIARLDSSNSSDKTIVIGAHYDCVGLGNGAYDNGSGVAVMLTLAKMLKNEKLPYNIEFVAFGAEELGMYGSKQYADLLSSDEIENTLLMINIDSVAAGDNLYLYAEDINTKFQQFFLDNSEQNSNSTALPHIFAKPIYKDIISLISGYGVAPYYQTAQASDNSSFRVKGIPSMLFFSGNFDAGFVGYVETKDFDKQIMHTSNDTIKKLKEYDGDGYIQKMQSVVTTIYMSLTDSDFVQVSTEARSQLVNKFWFEIWPAYVIFGLLLIGFWLFSHFYSRKLLKDNIINGSGKAEEKRTVFKAPDAEDIYDFLKK